MCLEYAKLAKNSLNIDGKVCMCKKSNKPICFLDTISVNVENSPKNQSILPLIDMTLMHLHLVGMKYVRKSTMLVCLWNFVSWVEWRKTQMIHNILLKIYFGIIPKFPHLFNLHRISRTWNIKEHILSLVWKIFKNEECLTVRSRIQCFKRN